MKKSQNKETLKEKAVGVAVFKAELSKYLAFVREGHELTILDHKMPIARVTAFKNSSSLISIPATKPFSSLKDVKLPKFKKGLADEMLTVLLEDRKKR